MRPYQQEVQDFYKSRDVQFVVIIMIMTNLLCFVVKLEIPLEHFTEGQDIVFHVLEIFFAVAFTIELAINMYGSWFVLFWGHLADL